MISQKLEVGQKLYSYSFDKEGNRIQKEHIITKLGKKFLEVGQYSGRYFVQNLKNEEFNPRYNPEYLFVSELAFLEWQELKESMEVIKKRFSGWGVTDLTLNQARKIKSILEEK